MFLICIAHRDPCRHECAKVYEDSVSSDPAGPGWGLRPEATMTGLMGRTHSHVRHALTVRIDNAKPQLSRIKKS